MKGGVTEAGVGSRRRISDREIEAVVRKEHEGMSDPMARYDRKPPRRFETWLPQVAGFVPQKADLRHCCERFYAQIDRDIREYDYRTNLALGVRQFVEIERRERRHRKAMRKLVRDDILRRGVRA